MKFLIILAMLLIGMNGCSKWLEDEELTLPKTPYTGNELRTDGYYYYKLPLASAGTTDTLLTACTATTTPPEGAVFHYDVLVESIQALGKRDTQWAVEEVWGCTVAADSSITPPSAG